MGISTPLSGVFWTPKSPQPGYCCSLAIGQIQQRKELDCFLGNNKGSLYGCISPYMLAPSCGTASVYCAHAATTSCPVCSPAGADVALTFSKAGHKCAASSGSNAACSLQTTLQVRAAQKCGFNCGFFLSLAHLIISNFLKQCAALASGPVPQCLCCQKGKESLQSQAASSPTHPCPGSLKPSNAVASLSMLVSILSSSHRPHCTCNAS